MLIAENSFDRAYGIAPTAVATAKKEAGTFPWLLFALSWPMLFWLHNEVDAPSQPYDAQSLADIVQGAEKGSSVARVVIVILGLVGIALIARYKERLGVRSRIATIALTYLFWTATTVVWSTDPSVSGRRIIAFALMTAFCAGCAARMTPFALTAFMAFIPVINLVPGLLAELYYGTFQPSSGTYRFGGTAPHPNVEAATLSVACILLCWLSWQTRSGSRSLYLVPIVLVAPFLYWTGSRTAIIAMTIALLFSLVLILVRDYRRAIPLVLASSCLMIGLFSFVLVLNSNSPAPHRTAVMQSHGEGDATTLNGRADLWKALLVYAEKRPLRGYGFGSFWTAKRIEDVTADQGWVIQQSHSAYIDQMLALGIPGALLYIVLLLSCLAWCSVSFLRHQDGYGVWAALFVFILVHNFTESIDVNPGFTNLAFFSVVLHIAFVRQHPVRQTLPGSPAQRSRFD